MEKQRADYERPLTTKVVPSGGNIELKLILLFILIMDMLGDTLDSVDRGCVYQR